MSLKSITYKEQFLGSELFNLDIFPPEVIVKFERGSNRFHLSASKESYDKIGLKKAANNRKICFVKCSMCHQAKRSYSSLWYHSTTVHTNIENWVIRESLEDIERKSLESQMVKGEIKIEF